MTWLAITGDRMTEYDAVFGLLPEAARWLEELLEAAWGAAERRLLDIGARTISGVLGCSWPDSGESGELCGSESLVRAYAEQFAVDPNGVLGGLDGELAARLSHVGAFDFVTSLNVLDGYLRACSLLGVDPRETPPSPDGAVGGTGPDSELPSLPAVGDGSGLRAYRLAIVNPRLSEARARFAASAHELDGLDPLTTEAVRLRNAWFHGCHY